MKKYVEELKENFINGKDWITDEDCRPEILLYNFVIIPCYYLRFGGRFPETNNTDELKDNLLIAKIVSPITTFIIQKFQKEPAKLTTFRNWMHYFLASSWMDPMSRMMLEYTKL
ncbi:hypothetical protein V1478_013574 [Vespula squamosa]|uniref:Uncharacterized protein n=1 Tax=Vespula squamosa TaxID=30214 RepID=A0ABD2A5J8_VESSQ